MTLSIIVTGIFTAALLLLLVNRTAESLSK